MIFTLLWLVLTTVVAGLSGVGVEDLSSAEYVKIDAFYGFAIAKWSVSSHSRNASR